MYIYRIYHQYYSYISVSISIGLITDYVAYHIERELKWYMNDDNISNNNIKTVKSLLTVNFKTIIYIRTNIAYKY